MSCSSCDKTKSVLSCVTELTVGTCANVSTAVLVYIRNNTTGRTYRIAETTTNTGLIVVSISDIQVIPNHNYELWVTLASATNIDERINITIDGEVKTCLDVPFEQVYSSANALQSGAQTLKLES